MRVVVFALGTPGLLALAIYAFASPHTSQVLAVALMTAVSAFAAGALIGFLFGIPRTAVHLSTDGNDLADGAVKSMYEPNTNLEQISDWLTKILVGVGLVQIGQLGGAVDDLADGLAESLGEDGHAVAVMLLVSFAVIGFLSAYLFTRMVLQNAFEPFREAMKKQEDTLTTALPLVRRQLDPGGDDRPSSRELAKALHAASSGIREEAFYLAREQRRTSLRFGDEDGDENLIELTIPVFETLIDLDDERRFHRTYAELAYALKDKNEPTPADYARARDSLSTAIEIRGPSGASSFSMYEFNRAYCNIKLDPDLKAGRPSAEALVTAICDDLEVALRTQTGGKAVRGDKTIARWIRQNEESDRVKELLTMLNS